MSRFLSQNLQESDQMAVSKDAAQNGNLNKSAAASTKMLTNASNKHLPLKKVKVLKNAFVLSKQDSVKLNLIQVAPTSLGYFESNVLTRALTPVEEIPMDQLVYRNDSLPNMVRYDSLTISPLVNDTLNLAIKDSVKVDTLVQVSQKPIAKTSTLQTERAISTASPFQESKIFLFSIVLLSVLMLGYMRLNSSRFLKTIFKGLFSHYESKRLFTTVNIRNSLHSVMLDVLFVFNFGVLAFEIVTLFAGKMGFLGSLLVFAGSVVAISIYFLLKMLLYRFVGYVFSTKDETNEYLFFVGVVNKTFGILLTPILVFLPFSSGFGTYIAVFIAGGIYLLLYIIQVLRGFKIILGRWVSLFYFIMYLCTLEILPFFIAYKVLIERGV